MSRGLKPASLAGLNVWAEAQTYLRSNGKSKSNGKSNGNGNGLDAKFAKFKSKFREVRRERCDGELLVWSVAV